MLIGRVIGIATSTVKHATLERQKLLVIQPSMADGETPDGDPVLAIDTIGAGRGDRVVISSDGRYARELVSAKATPIRWSVIGIDDE